MDYNKAIKTAKEKAMKLGIPFFIYKKGSNNYGVVSQEMAEERGLRNLLTVIDAKGQVHNEIQETNENRKRSKKKEINEVKSYEMSIEKLIEFVGGMEIIIEMLRRGKVESDLVLYLQMKQDELADKVKTISGFTVINKLHDSEINKFVQKLSLYFRRGLVGKKKIQSLGKRNGKRKRRSLESNEIEENKPKKKKRTKGFYSGAWNKAEKHTKYDPPKTGNKGKSARRGFIG